LAWRDWFISRHTRWLEDEVLRLRGELDAERKKFDALQLSVLSQNPTGAIYAQRMEPPEPFQETEQIGGTPWQKVLRKALHDQAEEARAESQRAEEARKAGAVPLTVSN
jgi:hypothetical protein